MICNESIGVTGTCAERTNEREKGEKRKKAKLFLERTLLALRITFDDIFSLFFIISFCFIFLVNYQDKSSQVNEFRECALFIYPPPPPSFTSSFFAYKYGEMARVSAETFASMCFHCILYIISTYDHVK